MRLSRKATRACVVLVGLGALFLLVGAILRIAWMLIASVPCLLVALFLQRNLMKCPHCHEATIPPQWAKGEKPITCPKCGEIVQYDDEE